MTNEIEATSKEKVSGDAAYLTIIGFLALLIALGVGWYISHNISDLTRNAATKQAYYVLLIVLSISVGIFLFGLLRSTAKVTHKQFGTKVELGGPTAAAALIVLGGFLLIPPSPEDFNLTVRFRPNDGHRASEIAKDSWVLIDIDAATQHLQLSPNADATIGPLPFRMKNSTAAIALESDGFRIKDRKAAYPIPQNNVIAVEVEVLTKINTENSTLDKKAKNNGSRIVKGDLVRITSGGTSDGHSPFCQRRSVQSCVSPQSPGGHLVAGSGGLADVAQTGRTGFSVIKDRPEQVCVELWAATSACETEVSISGRATAIEEYAGG